MKNIENGMGKPMDELKNMKDTSRNVNNDSKRDVEASMKVVEGVEWSMCPAIQKKSR